MRSMEFTGISAPASGETGVPVVVKLFFVTGSGKWRAGKVAVAIDQEGCVVRFTGSLLERVFSFLSPPFAHIVNIRTETESSFVPTRPCVYTLIAEPVFHDYEPGSVITTVDVK